MPPAALLANTNSPVRECVTPRVCTFWSSLHCFDADVGPAGARLLHCGVVRCEGVEAGVVFDGAVVALQPTACGEKMFW
jgi:hypothetical protein